MKTTSSQTTRRDIIQSRNHKPTQINLAVAPNSACASVPLVLDMDVDGILKVAAELFRFLLKQCVSRNDCGGSACKGKAI
jgi:hypothetical protein